MNLVHALRRTSILTKLVLTFMLTMTPLYFISLQINQTGSRNVKEEIIGSLESRLHYYLSAFEAEIGRIMRLQEQYAVDEDIDKLSALPPSMSDYEAIELQKRVQNKLLVLKSSSLFVGEAYAYIASLNRTLDSATYGGGMPDERIWTLQSLARLQQSPLAFANGQLMINSIFPSPVYSEDPPAYILQTVLSRREIMAFLPQATNHKDEEALLMNLGQGWSIRGGEDRTMDERIAVFLKDPARLGSPIGRGVLEADGRSYWVSYERSSLLDTYFVIYLPEKEITGQLHKYRDWIWIVSFVSFFVILAFSYWIYRVIHSPLRNLVRAFRRVEHGAMDVHIRHRNYTEFDYLYGQFNSMVSKLNTLIEEVYESQIRSQRSELKQLQSQINPHFLYNTYFMVRRLAEEYDYDNVARLAQHLGDYFLYITRNADDLVRLETEWAHTFSYIEIQSMRFGERIRTSVGELPECCRNLLVPKLFLQPIVENAYNHGLKDKLAGGIAELSARVEEGIVRIRIQDNGDDYDEARIERVRRLLVYSDIEVERTGLINVHRRLQLTFGKAYGIRISRGEMGGLAVDITIPQQGEG
ncbi:two-component system, sensor histidine kinase YesM [Cohnella sp. OV330]|uniref:sensor histidine kinase n=1 Tax=Cohnella sp. OV330 TaxID=1855288 RepID=UPI0008E8E637|nr:sensor histidine kinase [Cohnella sp. OV330]SFB39067.1 two-component system, sensor histidine kinase YesM [Cohnella sp. OV330]